MEHTFQTLYEYMLETKTLVYLLMGGTLVVMLLFWRLVTGRDDKPRYF